MRTSSLVDITEAYEIGKQASFVKQAFFDYVQALIQGEVEIPMKNGLPVY